MDNPVLKSAISSIVIYLIGLVAGRLGLTPDQVAGLSNAVVTVLILGGGSVVALFLTWFKARQHTQTALIQAVKDDKTNGVTPVAAVDAKAARIPSVSGPVK